MFALALFNMTGRGGLHDRTEAARLFAEAAKLGHAAAAYDLGLLYLEGQQFPQDFGRAAELFRTAATEGSPEAQYALATLYKDGRGVEKNDAEAARLLAAAALAENPDAEVEYAIALFNGTGVPKDEARAIALFRKAALRGSPIAQDRLARIFVSASAGRRPNPVQAIKWHLIAKAGGSATPFSTIMRRISPTRSARRPRRRRAPGSTSCRIPDAAGRPPCLFMFALDPTWRGGHAHHRHPSPKPRATSIFFMLRSALLNVMVAAARKAARSLKRDFGEVEKLQVSLQGPGQFRLVRRSPRRGHPARGARQGAAGLRLSRRGRRAQEGADKTHCWIVDPLDGTTNFLHGIPQFAISIGLERDGAMVAGLVYNPANEELFVAERGKGAFLNDQRLRVAARRRLADARGRLRAAASRPRRPRAVPQGIRRVQDKVAGLRRFGAASLDLAWVAAGRLDAYWERDLSPWDMAAGLLIVREAGGYVVRSRWRRRHLRQGGRSSPETNSSRER